MKKTLRPPIIAACALAALMLASVSTAHASPARPNVCSTCHSMDSKVTVKAVETANDGVSATYQITVSNPYGSAGWAVFAGSTKYVADATASESVMLPVGRTYTIWGVSSGSGDGAACVQVSAAGDAPPPAGGNDPVPPPVVPDPDEPGTPSVETSPPAEPPVVETGTLKIHIKRHCKKQCCSSVTLTSLETSDTASHRIKNGYVVLKDVAYGTYQVTVKTCKKTVTKNVVVDKTKTKVTLDLGKHCCHHKHKHHNKGKAGSSCNGKGNK